MVAMDKQAELRINALVHLAVTVAMVVTVAMAAMAVTCGFTTVSCLKVACKVVLASE